MQSFEFASYVQNNFISRDVLRLGLETKTVLLVIQGTEILGILLEDVYGTLSTFREEMIKHAIEILKSRESSSPSTLKSFPLVPWHSSCLYNSACPCKMIV